MHPRIVAVIDPIERVRAELFATVDQLPLELQEARPTEEAWSVAEILEHLSRVERGIAKLIALKVEELRAADRGETDEYTPVDVARFAIIMDRTRQIEAPERVAARGEWSADEARAALQQSREALLAALKLGDGLALSEVRHAHPILGDLNLYEWVYFVGVHELRHTAQIRAVAEYFSTTS
jgi:uncharacterized damage-inducible protein DinB